MILLPFLLTFFLINGIIITGDIILVMLCILCVNNDLQNF